MRDAKSYRAERRNAAHHMGLRGAIEFPSKPPGPGRRVKWLMRHPKLAPFYQMADQLLGGAAKWKALRKMMVVLAQSPRIKPMGADYGVPAVALLPAHQRGSWRSYPRVVIDANLKTAPNDGGKSAVLA